MKSFTAILAGIALMTGIGAAYAQRSATVEPNGELIYKTYCIGCHTTEVHWREKRLATDWTSLKFQVRRWLDNNGIGLSEDEVTALAGYLNRLYYNFPVSIAGTQHFAGTNRSR
jgi:mono/diheme cytochrome c family protein